MVAAIVLAAAVVVTPAQEVVPGANVNMVKGTTLPGGDPYLQRQVEPSLAVSTRNPCHLLGAGVDYRLTAHPGPDPASVDAAQQSPGGDAWISLFKSFDCGQRWQSRLLRGYPGDTVQTPLSVLPVSADPVMRAGTNGMFYLIGLLFERGDRPGSRIFVQRFIDHNNKEKGDTIEDLGTTIVDKGTPGLFLDKPWLAVDIPRPGFGPQETCDIGGQRFPAGHVYGAWASFEGEGRPGTAKIMFARSTNCGLKWDIRPISTNQKTSQGTTIAIDPNDGTVYVAWREIAHLNSAEHGIWVTKSSDGGRTFTRPRPVASPITPFTQPRSRTTFRSNALPTMTVDSYGRVYVAWAARGYASAPGRNHRLYGDSRIVLAVSTDKGATWSAPKPLDDDPSRPAGSHQVFPSLSSAGGRVTAIYIDFRHDECLDATKTFPALHCGGNNTGVPANTYVDGISHTGDIYAAQAAPAGATGTPAFKATKVSKYRGGLVVNADGTTKEISDSFHVNLPLFTLGKSAFIGDYYDIGVLSSLPVRRSETTQDWVPNAAAPGAAMATARDVRTAVAPMAGFALTTAVHPVWTDNRDVIPPLDGNWSLFQPPSFNALAACTPALASRMGSRDSNLYTSRLTQGLYVGTPGNTKNLGFTTVNGRTAHLQRSFVVFLHNTAVDLNGKGVTKHYRLTIVNQPGPAITDRASFAQFPAPPYEVGKARHDPTVLPVTEIFLSVQPLSTGSRSVYVTAANPKAQVRIDVEETEAPASSRTRPAVKAAGLRGSVMLNPDLTNPPITGPDLPADLIVPNIAEEELHAPLISPARFFDVEVRRTRTTTNVRAPGDQNPGDQNPGDQNPGDQNPGDQNPGDQNPGDQNPGDQNPGDQNPGDQNTALDSGYELTPSTRIRDVNYTVKNTGNTISRFRFSPVVSGERKGLRFQAIVTVRNNTLTVDANCNLRFAPDHQVLVNVRNFNPRNPGDQNPGDQNPGDQNPGDQNPGDQNSAYFYLAPGEEATTTLRIYYDEATAPVPEPEELEKQIAAVTAADSASTGEDAVKTSSAGPDLVASDPAPQVAPAAVTPGKTVALGWTLTNRGTNPTAPGTFVTRFFLSPAAADGSGPTADTADDIQLAAATFTGSVPADDPATAAAEHQLPFVQPLTIPGTLLPGAYVVVVRVDADGQVFEADDFNNTAELPLTVAPFVLAFAVQPGATTQDFVMTPPVQVAILDSDGQPVPPSAVPAVTLAIAANPAAGTLAGTTTRPTVGGAATFDDLAIDRVGMGYTLVATAPRSVAATSAAFRIETDAPPAASPDAYTATEDQALTVDATSGLLVNDTDTALGIRPPSRTITVALPIETQPQHGTVAVGADGGLTYTPNANFFGTDTFTYRADDGRSAGNAATVTITVREANDAPAASADAVTTGEDTALTIPAATLTGNDSAGPEESAQTLTVIAGGTSAQGGTVSVAGGQVTYTPPADFNGTDTFTYTVEDNGTTLGAADPLTASATVTVTVTAVNDAPVAQNQSVATAEDTAVAVTLGGTDIDSTTLSYAVATPPAHGTLSGSGANLTYTPAPGFTGSDAFTFTASDGTATSTVATVTITIKPANAPPSGTADSFTTNENVPLTVTQPGVLANDTDPDGDVLEVVLETPVRRDGFLDTTGLQFDGSAQALATGDGTVVRLVTAAVGQSGSMYAAQPVSITRFSSAFQFRLTGRGSTAGPDGWDGTGAGGDGFAFVLRPALPAAGAPPGGDFGIVGLAPSLAIEFDTFQNGHVSDPGSNHIGIDVNGSNVSVAAQPVAPDFDNGSLWNAWVDYNGTTLEIRVSPTAARPAAPTLSHAIDLPALFGSATGFAGFSGWTGSDYENQDVVRWFYSGVPAATALPAHGALVLNADGSFTYTPNANFNGTDGFSYVARDPAGERTAVTNVVITVDAGNDAPVANPDAVTTAEDSSVLVRGSSLTANDQDIDGDAVTVTSVSDPPNGAAGLQSFTVDAIMVESRLYTGGIPGSTPAALAAFSSATPGWGAYSPARQVSSLTGVWGGTGGSLAWRMRIDVTTSVAWPVSLRFGVDFGLGGTLLVDGQEVQARWSDMWWNFDWNRTGDILQGTVTLSPGSHVIEVYGFEDCCDGAMAGEIDLGAGVGTITTGSTQRVLYTPDANFTGADSFTYTVSDQRGGQAVGTVSVTVTPINDAPVAANDSYTTAGASLSVAAPGVLGNDTDVDSASLTAVLATAPSGGMLTLDGDGSFTYTPSPGFSGTDSFTYMATDGSASSGTATVTITVIDSDQAPTAADDSFVTTMNSTVTDAGLVGYWTMNEVAGTTAADSSGRNHHGTLIGAPSWSADAAHPAARRSLVFNGINQYVEVPNSDALSPATAVTMSAWVKPTAAAALAAVISKPSAPPSNGSGWALTMHGGRPGFAFNNGLVNCNPMTVSPLPLHTWSHVAATYAQDPEMGVSTARIYVNGQLAVTDSACVVGPLRVSGSSLQIGREFPDAPNGPRYFAGAIDDARVYDRALSDAEIAALMNTFGLVVPAPGVLANDADADHDPLTAWLLTGPSHGAVAFDADGGFTYTPSPQFTGVDTFTYRTNDGTTDSAAATVRITVVAVPSGPIDVAVGDGPQQAAVDADGQRAYVTTAGSGAVSVVDLNRGSLGFGQVIGTISGIASATAVALNPVTKRLYVAGGDVVSVFDADVAGAGYLAPLASIALGFTVSDQIAVDPTTNLIFAGHEFSHAFTVIDGATHTAATQEPSGACGPVGMAVNPATHRLYIGNTACGGVKVVDGDPASPTYLQPVTVFGPWSSVRGLAVDPSTNRVFAADAGAPNIGIASGATDSAIATVPTATATSMIAYSAATKLIYATGGGNLYVIDGDPASARYGTVLETRGMGASSAGVSVDAANGLVIVARPSEDVVTILPDRRP